MLRGKLSVLVSDHLEGENKCDAAIKLMRDDMRDQIKVILDVDKTAQEPKGTSEDTKQLKANVKAKAKKLHAMGNSVMKKKRENGPVEAAENEGEPPSKKSRQMIQRVANPKAKPGKARAKAKR